MKENNITYTYKKNNFNSIDLSLDTFAQEIQHFEPSSWWIGIKPQTSGFDSWKDISTFSLNVNYPE
ncbi:MAG: hypothetical protein IPO04_15700 [Cytophagaceae bacterium]|nr:hypothetical protein [Cytophagaceae bacterium]